MFRETPEIHSKWWVRVKGKIYQKINEGRGSGNPQHRDWGFPRPCNWKIEAKNQTEIWQKFDRNLQIRFTSPELTLLYKPENPSSLLMLQKAACLFNQQHETLGKMWEHISLTCQVPHLTCFWKWVGKPDYSLTRHLCVSLSVQSIVRIFRVQTRITLHPILHIREAIL